MATETTINPAKLYRAVNISSPRGTCLLCRSELLPGGVAGRRIYPELKGEAGAFYLTGRRNDAGEVDLTPEAQVEPKVAQRERRPDGCTCRGKRAHLGARTGRRGQRLKGCALYKACECPSKKGKYSTYIKHKGRCPNRIGFAELIETRPGFWDSFVHADCAMLYGFVTPLSARYTRGRRWEGLLDAKRVGSSKEEDDTTTTPEARAQEARRRESLERGRREMEAREKAEREATKAQREAEVEAFDDARTDRIKRVIEAAWDESAPAPLAELPDPSVERFRRLDLD